MNQVSISGVITSDIEIKRETDRYRNKIIHAKFDLEVKRMNETRKDRQREDLISCIAFGKEAEHIFKAYKRGSKIAATGRLQTNSYLDDVGDKKYFPMAVVIEGSEYMGRIDVPEDSMDGNDNIQSLDVTSDEETVETER